MEKPMELANIMPSDVVTWRGVDFVVKSVKTTDTGFSIEWEAKPARQPAPQPTKAPCVAFMGNKTKKK